MNTTRDDFWKKRDAAMKRFMAAKERKKSRGCKRKKSLCCLWEYLNNIPSINVHHRDPSSSDVKIHEFLGGLKEKPYFCNIQNINSSLKFEIKAKRLYVATQRVL